MASRYSKRARLSAVPPKRQLDDAAERHRKSIDKARIPTGQRTPILGGIKPYRGK